MSTAELTPLEVSHIVKARLGRDPQDMLEVAVVLEAWAGMPAQSALRNGAEVMRAGEATSQLSVSALPDAPDREREGVAAQAITLLVTVVAIAWWAGPLSVALGASVVAQALLVALPVSLATQWALQSRYLGRRDWLEQLAARPKSLLLGSLAMLAVPTAILGTAGLVAGLLALIWTGGMVLVRRGWALVYSGVVTLGTAGMLADLPATAMVAGVAVAVAVAVPAAVAAAMRPGRAPAARRPAQYSRVLAAAAIGAGLGVLLVADGSLQWTTSAGPALALLPSTVAMLWGGRRLWNFQQVICESLVGVPVVGGALPRRVAWRSQALLMRALGRVVAMTAVLSGALVACATWLNIPAIDVTVLLAFGLVAVATLLIGVLEAVGRAWWALAAVGAGVTLELMAGAWDLFPVYAGALIGGATAALLVALPAVIVLLARPANTLATALYVR